MLKPWLHYYRHIKMWKHQARQAWNSAKSFIHQGYSHLGKFAKDFNQIAGIGRRIFSLSVPMLEDLGQGRLIEKGERAFKEYDSVRNQVSNVDSKLRGHASRFDDANLFD